MTTFGAGLTLVGFLRGTHFLAFLGITCLTIGLTLALLGVLDVGLAGRKHWY